MTTHTSSTARILCCVTLVALFTGCATSPELQAPSIAKQASADTPAVLLVSLSDGSVVRQTVDVDARICMKSVSAPETVCFKDGAPFYGTDGGVIGREMIRTEIQLVAVDNASL